jgi:hypothetical protein
MIMIVSMIKGNASALYNAPVTAQFVTVKGIILVAPRGCRPWIEI